MHDNTKLCHSTGANLTFSCFSYHVVRFNVFFSFGGTSSLSDGSEAGGDCSNSLIFFLDLAKASLYLTLLDFFSTSYEKKAAIGAIRLSFFDRPWATTLIIKVCTSAIIAVLFIRPATTPSSRIFPVTERTANGTIERSGFILCFHGARPHDVNSRLLGRFSNQKFSFFLRFQKSFVDRRLRLW